ncbi:hypothetical protein MASR2M117_23840 [Paludibacter sp.]
MSYTRTYRERIAVHYSGSISYSYPASSNGGSGTAHYSGTEYEDVNVTIKVDTDPFDASVENCNSDVNMLTGAVVATEVAQIASIDENSKKVGSTIISGFFGYIRSEISQQVVELAQRIDSQLMHLKELSKAVIDKRRQMEGDFMRISSRYVKIFDDLNNELTNRIHEIDKPTFTFKKELDNQNIRSTNNDLVNTVTVFGKEGGELHSKISASITKKRALDTLFKAKSFLWQQKKLNNTTQQSMLNENVECKQYIPVCFMETIDQNQIGRVLYSTNYVSALQNTLTKNELIEQFTEPTNSWKSATKEHTDNLRLFFNSELDKSYSTADQHSVRVKEMIQKLANISSLKTISY